MDAVSDEEAKSALYLPLGDFGTFMDFLVQVAHLWGSYACRLPLFSGAGSSQLLAWRA